MFKQVKRNSASSVTVSQALHPLQKQFEKLAQVHDVVGKKTWNENMNIRIDNQIWLILVVGSAASENITVTLGDEVHVIVVESKKGIPPNFRAPSCGHSCHSYHPQVITIFVGHTLW